MRLCLAMVLCACGANEPPPVQQKAAPSALPSPIASAAPIVDAGDDDPEPDPHRVLRGQLIHTRGAYGGLRKHDGTTQCTIQGDAGMCTPRSESDVVHEAQKNLSIAFEDAKAFAATHSDALPAELMCLRAMIERTDRLVWALGVHAAAGAERAAIDAQVTQCDAAIVPTIAVSGPPLPTRSADAGVSLHGRLAPEIIQRIVRANFGRFKLCYTKGLKRDHALEGRAELQFIIDIDGSVADFRMHASTLSDAEVLRCLVRAVSRLQFPPPDGGYVTVIYPLIFSASDPP